MGNPIGKNGECLWNTLYAVQDKDTPLKTDPHYTEDDFRHNGQVVFGSEEKKYEHSAYLDRMHQWDSKKYEAAYKHANTTSLVKGSCHWWEEWLGFYYDKKVEMAFVKAGVRPDNGYSWTVFCFNYVKEVKETEVSKEEVQ